MRRCYGRGGPTNDRGRRRYGRSTLAAGPVLGAPSRRPDRPPRGLAALAAWLAASTPPVLRPRPGRPRLPEGPDGPELRVAFANLWCSYRTSPGVLGELAGGKHDIVAMAEVTDDHVPVIDSLLPASTYPWRRIEPDPSPGSEGLALVSRVPLSHVETWSSQGHPQFDAVVVAPSAGAFRLLVVHTWGPWAQPGAGLASAAGRGRRPGPRAGPAGAPPSPRPGRP